MGDLKDLMKEMEKKFGEGSVFVIGNKKDFNNVERWPIEDLVLTDVMGGGLPKGRIIEVYGPESHGKTSIVTYLAGEVQGSGGTVAYIDAEHALDIDYAKSLGLDPSKLIFSQPNSGEEALNIIQTLAESGKVDLIVTDSIAALTPKAELEGEMESQQMGAQARMLGKACRKISALLGKNKCTWMLTNQIRMKIGVMYGNPETTPGGNAIKFFSSIRLEVRRKEYVGDKESPVGIITGIKAVKNKVGTPMKRGEIKILFWKGIQVEEEFIDFALSTSVLERRGTFYFYDNERVGQGKDNTIEYFKNNKDKYDELKKRVSSRLNPESNLDGTKIEAPKREVITEEDREIIEELSIDDENLENEVLVQVKEEGIISDPVEVPEEKKGKRKAKKIEVEKTFISEKIDDLSAINL